MKKTGLFFLDFFRASVYNLVMYENLSRDIAEIISENKKKNFLSPFACKDESCVRRKERDKSSVLRSAFWRDADKIMNCPYFSRYADKTQVFSLRRNDDITRRSLHVQLVSRIARNIGKALALNTELIEAIALGHDIGHTPFGHAGEKILDGILSEYAGRRFFHNVQSVRALDKIFDYNVSLQTLNGILAHNGETLEKVCYPKPMDTFDELDNALQSLYYDGGFMRSLYPSTLEGCVVRLSDVIAYVGKDRQDAEKTGLKEESGFADAKLGGFNAEIINNLTVNVVENSYGKNYIALDDGHFESLKAAVKENYGVIYDNPVTRKNLSALKPMTEALFTSLLSDLKENRRNSPIFTHHLNYVKASHYERSSPYEKEEPEVIVADFIASMTDDFFIALYERTFPDAPTVKYSGYFD